MKTERIKVNNDVIKLSPCCHWGVDNGILRNLNTGFDEGVEGDIVEYEINGVKYRGHVKGYTCYQMITTEEFGSVCLSAKEYHEHTPLFIHQTKVELITE